MATAALPVMSRLLAPAEIPQRFVPVTFGHEQISRNEKAPLELSLILPTYNERENLRTLFARIDRALTGCRFEVILVDDDSPDKTWAAAHEFQEQYPWLRVICRRSARGLSSAVICGFRHACGKILGVMDADLQHDVDVVPALLNEIEHADFAIATRRAAGGTDGNWSKLRRGGSFIATALAQWIAGMPSSDPMSGFFLMRREIFQLIDKSDLRPRGYKILVYLYVKAAEQFGRKTLRLAEVGYQFANRLHGQSKVSLKVMVDYFLMLVALRFAPRAGIARPRWSHAIF